ncbi:unnamed protein product [Prorocentrum cordatum]|uniref:Uncharacterized protein n=1 Tax=Prorocentrum cordatum TaxID=2364126 RepID=A0ABN9S139_9DINO|nr:unnamed protein product [Polarella glacialis]
MGGEEVASQRLACPQLEASPARALPAARPCCAGRRGADRLRPRPGAEPGPRGERASCPGARSGGVFVPSAAGAGQSFEASWSEELERLGGSCLCAARGPAATGEDTLQLLVAAGQIQRRRRCATFFCPVVPRRLFGSRARAPTSGGSAGRQVAGPLNLGRTCTSKRRVSAPRTSLPCR